MENRQNLKNDIEFFVEKSTKDYNQNETFDKKIYLDISQRIKNLTISDFETEEKYKYFQDYLRQDQRWADKHFFDEQSSENNLPNSLFLWVSNFLIGTANWLK